MIRHRIILLIIVPELNRLECGISSNDNISNNSDFIYMIGEPTIQFLSIIRNNNKTRFIVSQHTHYLENNINLFLPVTAFHESTGVYINNQFNFQTSYQAVDSPASAYTHCLISQVIYIYFKNNDK